MPTPKARPTASGSSETLLSCGGEILLYRPQLQHHAIRFGDMDGARHVAVFVPGVGDSANLCDDWIPEAKTLFEEAESTSRRAVEGL